VLDCALELRNVAQLLEELVQVDSGEVVAVPRRLVLNAGRPFDTFIVDAPNVFHSVKIDNLSGAPVEMRFDGTAPLAGSSDERVPAGFGRIITRPYGEVAIGFDPANVPAGDSVIRCTFYSRPYPPTTYALAGASGLGVADTVAAAGSVGGTGAGTVIVTIPASQLPAGIYLVTVTTRIPVDSANEDSNMELRRGGVLVARLFAGNTGVPNPPMRVTLDGTQSLDVRVGSFGPTTVVYNAALTAQRVA
jgi:hypothetical protein